MIPFLVEGKIPLDSGICCCQDGVWAIHNLEFQGSFRTACSGNSLVLATMNVMRTELSRWNDCLSAWVWNTQMSSLNLDNCFSASNGQLSLNFWSRSTGVLQIDKQAGRYCQWYSEYLQSETHGLRSVQHPLIKMIWPGSGKQTGSSSKSRLASSRWCSHRWCRLVWLVKKVWFGGGRSYVCFRKVCKCATWNVTHLNVPSLGLARLILKNYPRISFLMLLWLKSMRLVIFSLCRVHPGCSFIRWCPCVVIFHHWSTSWRGLGYGRTLQRL